jgi:hypothetical protein
MRYIGYSVSRCVRDIVKKRINIYAIEIIIGRTMIENEQHIAEVARGYHSLPKSDYRSWTDLDIDACQKVLLELYRDGKLHQPRLYGKYPIRMDNHWGVIAPFPMSAF